MLNENVIEETNMDYLEEDATLYLVIWNEYNNYPNDDICITRCESFYEYDEALWFTSKVRNYDDVNGVAIIKGKFKQCYIKENDSWNDCSPSKFIGGYL